MEYIFLPSFAAVIQFIPDPKFTPIINTSTHLNKDEITLKEFIFKLIRFWKFLLSKWLIIAGVGIVCLVAGYTYAKMHAPVYTARTTFVLESNEQGASLGQYAGLASMFGVELGAGGGGLFQGDNILELYKSRNMVQKTLLTAVSRHGQKRLLVDWYLDVTNGRALWKSNPDLQKMDFALSSKDEETQRLQDSVLGSISDVIIKDFLMVEKPDTKLNIIKVDIISKSEFFAKNFNDQLVKNVNDFYIETKTRKSLNSIAILQHKADSVRHVMNGAIYAVAALSDATPNMNATRQVQRAAPMQRTQFSAEANKAILSEMMKNLELAKMAVLKETPLIQVVDKPIYPLAKKSLGNLKTGLLAGIAGGILAVFVLFFVWTIKSIMA